MMSKTNQSDRRGIALAKVLLVCGALAGIGAVGASLAFSGTPAPQVGAGALDVSTATVMDFNVTTTATGELEAARQIEIRNRQERATTIVDIVPEGTQAKAGDILVRLNADEVQNQVDTDQLQVLTARAELAAAEAGYAIQVSANESTIRKAHLAFDLAELELRQWQEGELASKRQDLSLALEKATREHDRLKEKYDRSKSLEARGFLSKDELKRDELAFLEAQAAVKTAQLDVQVFNEFQFPKDKKTKESALEEARAELDRAQRKADSELATKEAERSKSRRQLELREQRLAKLREQVEAAALKAPSDGLVVYATSMERNRGDSSGGLQIGQQVYQNQALILLPDTSEMNASVRVSESLAGRIRKGQNATVKVDALGGKSLRGTVESVGILAEQGGWRDPNLREYTVKIKLEMEPGLSIRPSMRCEAEIQIDRISQALAVPVQSVFSEGLVRYVHVPVGAKFQRRPVKVGRRSDRYAEIAAGLEKGDRVLARKPEAREVLATPWDRAELAAAGLEFGEDGKIRAIGAAADAPDPTHDTLGPAPGSGSGPPRGNGGGGRPRGERPQGGPRPTGGGGGSQGR